MLFNQEDDIEEMTDDYEMCDVDYVLDKEFLPGEMENSESDEDEYRNLDPRITDTSSAQARRGKDIQGIPWDRLDITRNEYRQTTLEEFGNYESIPASGERSKKACKPTRKGGKYYEFQHNTRIVRSTRLHLQVNDKLDRKGRVSGIVTFRGSTTAKMVENNMNGKTIGGDIIQVHEVLKRSGPPGSDRISFCRPLVMYNDLSVVKKDNGIVSMIGIIMETIMLGLKT